MNELNDFVYPEGIRKLENGKYEVASVVFCSRELVLTADSERIELQYQTGMLLSLFLESEACFVTREEIFERLWKEEKLDRKTKNDRLNTTVKRLRDVLAVDPDIHIDCRFKRGYYLRVRM